jgi:arylsulfatase A-like enzyme
MRAFPRIALAALLVALASVAAARPPNILLLVTDDQRPDTIRALGNGQIDTPHLDRLVQTGSAFTRAIAAVPHCVPSRAEILTGASGFTNRSPPFGRAIQPRLATWAATMRQAGYHAWYSGKWMNDGSPRTRGYEETSALYSAGGAGPGAARLTLPTAHNGRPVTGYTGWTFKTNDDQPEPEKGVGLTPLTDRHIADGAIALLRRATEQPFFLHVNFTAPHDPLHIPPGYGEKYDPATLPLPPNFLPEHPFDHGNAGQRDEALLPVPRDPAAVRREIAAYYAVVSHLDSQVGRILDALRATGRDRDTVVIFTSDNGLALGSHGLMGKQNMYEHTIGVPLVLAGPGIPRDRRFAAQAYLRDLFPTVCELAGIPIPATVEGQSLVPVLAGTVPRIHSELYACWHRDGVPGAFPMQRMVRTDRWKLIHYAHLERRQLFDLESDPHELRDLSSDPRHAATMAGLQRQLDAWFAPRIEAHRPADPKPGK